MWYIPVHHIPFIVLAVIVTHAQQVNYFFTGKGKGWVDAQVVAYIFYAEGIHAAGCLETKIIIIHIQTEFIAELCKPVEVTDKLVCL